MDLRSTIPWALATLDEYPELPPLEVVSDVGLMLLGQRPAPRGHRRYEDHLLGRLMQDHRALDLIDAMARVKNRTELCAAAIGVFLGRVLRRIGFRGLVVKPGALRAMLDTRQNTIPEDPEIYESLARAGEYSPALIEDSDVFVLDHIDVLRLSAHRVAVDQIHEVLAWLDLPKHIRPSKRQVQGNVQTRLDDESAYPAGGFSSISTQGCVENLVTSELVYLEPSEPVDLFTVRLVEGELLYYQRDEALLHRAKRQVHLALGDIPRLRVEGLRWQRHIMLFAVVAAIVQSLQKRLGEEDLRIKVWSPTDPKLLSLVLQEWIESGLVEIVRERPEDVVDLSTWQYTDRASWAEATTGLIAGLL